MSFSIQSRGIVCASLLAASSAFAQTYRISTLYGSGPTGANNGGYGGDGGPAQNAQFFEPHRLARDNNGNIYVADRRNHRIRKIDPSGIITTVAGTGTPGFSGDGGAAAAAQLSFPGQVVLDPAGNLIVADTGNGRIRRINSSGIISTLAGGGASSADNISATLASVPQPEGIAVDLAGNIFIAVTAGAKIRKVSTSGVISTVAGTGVTGFSGDGGLATSATFNAPWAVYVSANGTFFIADTNNHRFRKVDPSGIVTTIMGDGVCASSGDGGPAISARVCNPGTIVEYEGSLYIGSTDELLRRIDPIGIVTTIAGVPGLPGFSGDGGPSTSARISSASGFAFTPDGAILFTDHNNHRIRRLDPKVFNGGLIVNGSFEEGDFGGQPSFRRLPAGSNFLPGWQIGLVGMDWHNEADFKFPKHGNKMVDFFLDGSVGGIGSITQDVATVPGRTYALRFSLASPIVAGSPGSFLNPRPLVVLARTGTGTVVAARTFTATPSPNDNLQWIPQDWNFVATSTVTRLEFSPAPIPPGSTTIGFWGPVIDAVSVTPVGGAGVSALIVPGTSNPWLAGMPNGSLAVGDDVAPNQSPVEVLGVSITPNSDLLITANGCVNNDPSPCSGDTPRGGSNLFPHLGGAENGIAALTAPANSLIGVFLGAGRPDANAAPGPFNIAPAATVVTPVLQQPFFIGDGRNSSGATVRFRVPAGATRLFLGTMDGYSWLDNSGRFEVQVRLDSTVGGPPAISSSPLLPNATLGVAYSFTPTLTGGLAPFVWQSSSPLAGRGFTLSSSGVLSGRPTGAGVTPIAFTVRDALGREATQSAVLTVSANPGFVISPGTDVSYRMDTIAGLYPLGDGGPARLATPFTSPADIAFDSAGNYYVSEYSNGRIRKVSTAGIVTTIAGGAYFGVAGEGIDALKADVDLPSGVAPDGSGGLYYSEGPRIRRINASGTVVTVAGTGTYGFSGDGGPALAAEFYGISDIWRDPAGNLYVCDFYNHRVRKIDSSGVITTIAGNGVAGFSGDGGPAVAASLYWPEAVIGDGAGNLFIADRNNNRIRKVSTTGTITTFAGTGAGGYSGDGGPAASAQLFTPTDLAFDSASNLYIADSDNRRVRKVTPSGIITTIAGTGQPGLAGNGGPATAAPVSPPISLAVSPTDQLHILDGSFQVRRIDGVGNIDVVAGALKYVGNGGPAVNAKLIQPTSIAFRNGNLYVAEQGNCLIRLVRSGLISIVAGDGICTGDSLGYTTSGIFSPEAIAVGSNGTIYFVRNYYTISQINAAGLFSDLVTLPSGSLPPAGLAVDNAGNVYAALPSENRVIRITPTGVVSTVAGTGTRGFSGDGGLATSAMLALPQDVAIDRAGNLFIADIAFNGRIRKVSNGVITTVAGSGTPGFSGDGGPALSADINVGPIDVGPDGTLVLGDRVSRRVRIVRPDGIITTVAGNGYGGYFGDGGPALSAAIHRVGEVAVGDNGVIYIADAGTSSYSLENDMIRQLTPCAFQTNTSTASASALGGDASFTITSTPSNCAFSAVSSSPWITFPSSSIATTPATLLYRVAAVGSGGGARAGTILVNGLTLTVNQAGAGGGSAPPAATGLIPAAGTPPSVGLSSTGDSTGTTFEFDSNGPPVSWTASASAPWVRLSPSQGTTPARVRISAEPAGLAPGIYSAVVTFRPQSGSPWSIPVTLTLNVPTAILSQRGDVVLSRTPGFTSFQATIPLTASAPGTEFSATVSGGGGLTVTPSSGRLPARITVSSAAGLQPGEYVGSLRVRIGSGAADTRVIPVRFVVPALGPPQMVVRAGGRTFAVNSGNATALRQILVENVGTGSVNFTSSVTQTGARPWLRVLPESGITTNDGAAPIELKIDLRGFPPGTYKEVVRVQSQQTRTVIEVPIAVAVNPKERALGVAPTGLYFEAVQGGPPTASKQFNVINDGIAELGFQAAVNSGVGNGTWLRLSTAQGTARAGTVANAVNVSADPAGLSEGVYYGLIEVSAPSADNSPQFVVAVLNVRAPAARLLPAASPDGLLFVAVEGGASPVPQAVVVANPSARKITAAVTVFAEGDRQWFTVDPVNLSMDPGRSAQILVQPALSSLGAPPLTRGVYRGQVAIGYVEDGVLQLVDVTLVVAPPGTSLITATASSKSRSAEGDTCAASRLIATFTQTGSNFQATAGWPGTVEVKVVDDCGRPLTAGSAVAGFSNGDPLLTLRSLGDGRWSGMWSPQRPASTATVTVRIRSALEPVLEASTQVSGSVQPALAPVIQPGGVINGAGEQADAPLAPGTLAKVIGDRLAVTSTQSVIPWPTELGGTRVLVGPRIMRLESVGDKQLKGVIPFGLAANSSYSVVVSRGSQLSMPETVTLAEAQPAVFTPDGSGRGQGSIFVVQADGKQVLADAANPAAPGDSIVLYCSGLGPVTPAVPDGAAAPSEPLSQAASDVTLSIGGVTARVLFAGLSPGQSGLYQINAVVPETAPTGDGRFDLLVTAAGQTSQPVSMVVRRR